MVTTGRADENSNPALNFRGRRNGHDDLSFGGRLGKTYTPIGDGRKTQKRKYGESGTPRTIQFAYEKK